MGSQYYNLQITRRGGYKECVCLLTFRPLEEVMVERSKCLLTYRILEGVLGWAVSISYKTQKWGDGRGVSNLHEKMG